VDPRKTILLTADRAIARVFARAGRWEPERPHAKQSRLVRMPRQVPDPVRYPSGCTLVMKTQGRQSIQGMQPATVDRPAHRSTVLARQLPLLEPISHRPRWGFSGAVDPAPEALLRYGRRR
jgi:hypothetical protein